MSINYLPELHRLVENNYQTDQLNIQVLEELISYIEMEIQCVENFLCQEESISIFTNNLLEKLDWITTHQLELESYNDNTIMKSLYEMLTSQELKIADIEYDSANKLFILEKLLGFKYLELEIVKKIKHEGYQSEYNAIREIIKLVTSKKVYKCSVNLFENYLNMKDLVEDLEREKRKNEQKVINKEHARLLKELRELRSNYKKDVILLLEGLLKTEGDYYYSLKGQLDEQYNKEIENKVIVINKLVNMQKIFYLDINKIRLLLESYSKDNARLMTKLIR